MATDKKRARSRFSDASAQASLGLPDLVAHDLLGQWRAPASTQAAATAGVEAATADRPAGPGRPPASGIAVTSDQADYAPGSEAMLTATGLREGAAVRFALRDLASDPGADGEADDYGSPSSTPDALGAPSSSPPRR